MAWRGAGVRGLGCHSADATGHSGQVALAVRSAACICGTCMYMWHVQGLAGCNHGVMRAGDEVRAHNGERSNNARHSRPLVAHARAGPAQTQAPPKPRPAQEAALAARGPPNNRATRVCSTPHAVPARAHRGPSAMEGWRSICLRRPALQSVSATTWYSGLQHLRPSLELGPDWVVVATPQ